MKKSSQKRQQFLRRVRSTPVLILLSLVVVAGSLSHGFGVFAATCSSSADCQQQIDSLNAQNAQAQNSLGGLQAQASSYQDAINKLQAQIDSLQSQIVANQAQQADLQQKITDAQAKLEQQKSVLANDIKATYVGGQLTPVEMLATSDNLSDYIDRQQAYSAVQDKIQDTLKQINALQLELKQQKDQVDQLVAAQQAQRGQLASAQNQQTGLLNLNQSQQDQFNQQIASNKSALSQLYAKQAAIIAASFGGGIHYGGTGGYPWPSAPCLNSSGDCSAYSESPYNWGVNGQPHDPAGWQYRNCTSYAFWRLAQTTSIILSAGSFTAELNSPNGGIKYAVLGYGSYGGDFQRLGYNVDHTPSSSSTAVQLAVNTGGSFGHIMYVESVSGGQAIVSQYNAAGDGRYSTGTLSSGSSIWFVHIRD